MSSAYISCSLIEGHISIEKNCLALCCSSHAAMNGCTQIGLFSGNSLPVEMIVAQRKLYRDLLNSNPKKSPCFGCPELKMAAWLESPYLLDAISINDFHACNLRCDYCTRSYSEDDPGEQGKRDHQLFPLIKDAVENSYIRPGAFFSWGGGEVALYMDFEPTARYLVDHGFHQVINTNATFYSPVIEYGLKTGLMEVQVSVDSGTRGTYQVVKGKDVYENVWKNITRYAHAGTIIVKYIVKDNNCQQNEIDSFIDCCLRSGVTRIVVAPENYSLVNLNISEEVLQAAAYLIHKAIQKCIKINNDAENFGEQYGQKIREYLSQQKINVGETMTSSEVVERLSTMLQQLSPAEVEKFYSALAPVVADMAKTGKGTDACLNQGCLPLPVHYYSPVPDIGDLQRRGIYSRISNLSGVDWNTDQQSDLLIYLGRRFGRECNWSPHPTSNPDDFFTENDCFSFCCAAALHCIIRFFQPQRIMEIGSGNSSKIINAAVQLNKQQFGGQYDYTICDPYPDEARIGRLASVSNLLRQRAETLPLSTFSNLSDGDVLFIDSGHVVKTGGDVNFLILDVLPNLAPGVVIHFHDIPMPYEYSEVYHTRPSSRVFWTESYLLQAFLACNHEFETLFSVTAITAQRPDVLRTAFPLYDPSRHLLGSGSIWLRRKKI